MADPVNYLLSQLAVHERNAIHRASETQFHEAGERLLSANTHSTCVFFPIDMVVSIVRPMRARVAVEIGLIGNEGIIGLDVMMDAKTQLDDAVVQSAGFAYRMPAEELLNQVHGGGRLQQSLLRFAHAFLGQVAQNAICNRYHPLQSRLAKWLLMVNDRTAKREVRSAPCTIGDALGASEGEVVSALAVLMDGNGGKTRAKAIAIDRDRLEVRACECYETLRQEYTRTLAS
jgi:hypothetical protein